MALSLEQTELAKEKFLKCPKAIVAYKRAQKTDVSKWMLGEARSVGCKCGAGYVVSKEPTDEGYRVVITPVGWMHCNLLK